MVKGCRRELILLRTPESETIEEAYFVLRRKQEGREDAERMIEEANRILAGNLIAGRRKRKRRRGGGVFFSFLAGLVLGALSAAVLFLVL